MDPYITQYKLAILFLLKNVAGGLTLSQLCDVLLEKLYNNFFHLQQALQELAESQLVEPQKEESFSYYRITPEGEKYITYLDLDLGSEVKKELQARLKALRLVKTRTLSAQAHYSQAQSGGYTARCQLIDGGTPVIDLRINLPGEEAAWAVCENWPSRCEHIYTALIEELI